MNVRRAVLGDEHVDRALSELTDFTRDFDDFITRYAWDEIWTRPGLERAKRSLVTIAMLTALGRTEELSFHVRAALENGVTKNELKEVLLQSAVYCGVPAARAAFRAAQAALVEIEGTRRAR